MSLRGSLFSPYQQKLKGIMPREYYRGHVVYEQMKIDSVNSNKNNFIGVSINTIFQYYMINTRNLNVRKT